MSYSVEDIRSQFPVLARGDKEAKPLAFLDSTATTQKPTYVIDAMEVFYREHYSSVKRGVYKMSERTTQAFEKTRKIAASYVGAKAESEIVFTQGTTAGINLVAWSYGLKNFKPGDEVLVSALEHHANIVPWQLVGKERGTKLKVIPANDDAELELDKLPSLLASGKVKVAAFTHVSNATGTVNPIKEMIAEIRRLSPDTKILIDAAQSASHLPLDVQDLDCDFLAFSGHKMYGPTGIGVLYGKAELLNDMPPMIGGGEMIDKVTFEETTFAPPPERFEAGTPPIAEVIGLGAALEWINQVGLDNIRQHEEEITNYALSRFAELPELRVLGNPKHRGALISTTLKGIHPHDAAMILDEENVAVRSGHHCAQPVMDRFCIPATLRFSFAAYTTKAEIDRAVHALKRVVNLFS